VPTDRQTNIQTDATENNATFAAQMVTMGRWIRYDMKEFNGRSNFNFDNSASYPQRDGK